MQRFYLQRALDHLADLTLRLSADDRLHLLAALENGDRRNRHHSVITRGVRVLVDVELHDLDLVAQLAGDLVQYGRNLAARPAPLRPEIDDYRLVALQNVAGPAGVGD